MSEKYAFQFLLQKNPPRAEAGKKRWKKDRYRDRKETGWEEIKEAGRREIFKKRKLDKTDETRGQRWSEGAEEGGGKKEGKKRERGEGRRVNASCFLTRSIFNQHCLYSSNNRRKLARLGRTLRRLLILALESLPPSQPTPRFPERRFPLKNERRSESGGFYSASRDRKSPLSVCLSVLLPRLYLGFWDYIKTSVPSLFINL